VTDVDLIEQALAVAREGRPVFPCDAKKRPCWSCEDLGVGPGEGGFKAATTDPEEIKRLFAHPRAALIGVPTGTTSGLAVVDVDVKDGKGGQQWYDAHITDLGLTRWHRTKSGGVHLVYQINGYDPGCSAGVIHDGVDLRGGGGYVIWWPAAGCEFGDVELAPFPEWIARESDQAVEGWATLADDDLEQHILEATSFHQPMISLAWRMAADGYSGQFIQDHLRGAFDRSVAANPKHPRHRDWTRRKLDIFRTVQSAVEKAGRAEVALVHTNATESTDSKETDHAPKPTQIGQVTATVGAAAKATAKAAVDLPAISDYPGTRFDGKPVPELEFAIEDLVPAGRLCNIAGLGGAGKGILMQIAATCTASGLPFLGKDVRQGPVAYYGCEDDDDVLHHRQARINELLGLPATPDGLFIKSYLGHDLTVFDGKKWRATFDWLWDDMAKIDGLVAAVLDPASEFFVGEYADAVAVKTFCKRLDARAAERDVTLFLLMHTAKGGEGQKTPFGSVQWMNAARTTLMLDPVVGEDGKSGDQAVLRVGKGNYFRAGEEIALSWTDDGLLVLAHEPDAYEKIARARELEALIVDLCDTAWRAGAPLSDASQARERYLPAKVRQVAKSKFSKREITETMESMMRAGKLKLGRTQDRRGLKVAKSDNE